MKARYSERIHAKRRVIIAVGPHVNEGRILNLTVPGCLLEGPLCVNKTPSNSSCFCLVSTPRSQ